MTPRSMSCALILGALFVGAAQAEIRVDEPWVRATVPHPMATGAFLTLTADPAATLVSVSSPAAGKSEIHEMVMEGEVMKMRALRGLSLPAGKTVELRPGSYHVMLLDLKDQVSEGRAVPLVLTFDVNGKRETREVSASVRQMVHMQGH